jgi:chaperonin cofactor prefoldin
MFKNEVKNELQTIFTSSKNIDNEIVNIKIAIHNLEKLGLDTKEFYKLLDNLGIEFKKLKDFNADFTKEKLKNN